MSSWKANSSRRSRTASRVLVEGAVNGSPGLASGRLLIPSQIIGINHPTVNATNGWRPFRHAETRRTRVLSLAPMGTSTDVAIVGGGAMGSAIAYFLASDLSFD